MFEVDELFLYLIYKNNLSKASIIGEQIILLDLSCSAINQNLLILINLAQMHKILKDAPILIFANKQDIDEKMSAEEIYENL